MHFTRPRRPHWRPPTHHLPCLRDRPQRCSLSEQQRKQQRQLREFFDGVDVLTSTESSSIGAAESTFEGMFAGDRTQSVPRVASGGGINRGWMAAGGSRIPTEAEYGTGTGDEGGAAAAVRKSVYHLRQLKQVNP